MLERFAKAIRYLAMAKLTDDGEEKELLGEKASDLIEDVIDEYLEDPGSLHDTVETVQAALAAMGDDLEDLGDLDED